MCRHLDEGEYFGRVVSRRVAGAFTFIETAYRPGEALPQHGHARPFLCVVLAGGYEERASTARTECDAGATACHFDDLLHSDRFGRRGGHCVNIEFEADWLAPLTRAGRRHPLFYLPPARTGRVARRLTALLAPRSIASGLQFETLATELVGVAAGIQRCGGATRSRPDWLEEALDFVHADYRRGFTLSDLARALQRHPAHVARCFRRHLGLSVGEYARRLRAIEAQRTIIATRRPLAELAADFGYTDQAHLTREVARLFGRTPGRLRQSAGA